MGKVTDISKGCVGGYMTLSKTPKNRDKGNFFMKELQDKYNAEWKYAPDVVDVEFEKGWGTGEFDWIEVRDQKVRSDKNKAYSDDARRLVFRDIWEKRFRIGSKFRFSERFDESVPEASRSVWLATNASYASPATSVVVTRCNGRLGFRLADERGISKDYYEPVIFGGELKGVDLYENQTAVSPESELTAVLQHNARTATFYINQRFVVGYDQVYRVKGLNKSYSRTTDDPHDPGLMILYLELTEKSEKDEFGDVLIAYNESHDVIVHDTDEGSGDFAIDWVEPAEFPVRLPTTATVFSARVLSHGEPIEAEVEFSYELENLPEGVDPDRYVEFEADGNSFTIRRKRQYPNGNITVVATYIPKNGEETKSSFSMGMNGF
jgi:hypothetical protein